MDNRPVRKMKVLVACEYSGRVRDAFIKLGHDAMSCDLLPTDVPGPHYQGDMFDLDLASFDLVIAHPPCTALCVSGNRHYAGTQDRLDGAAFVQRIWDIPVKRLVIENPVGVINSINKGMPKPQYVQPWQFGHGETKKTGLWKRGLPDLVPTDIVDGRADRIHKLPPSKDRWKIRSTTYQGIADAMAAQWGGKVTGCPKCGSEAVVHLSSLDKRLCADCGHKWQWKLKKGQWSLAGDKRGL